MHTPHIITKCTEHLFSCHTFSLSTCTMSLASGSSSHKGAPSGSLRKATMDCRKQEKQLLKQNKWEPELKSNTVMWIPSNKHFCFSIFTLFCYNEVAHKSILAELSDTLVLNFLTNDIPTQWCLFLSQNWGKLRGGGPTHSQQFQGSFREFFQW